MCTLAPEKLMHDRHFPLRVVFSQAVAPTNSSADTIIGNLHNLEGERALVIGPDTEIVRELVERGCREVTEVEDNEWPKQWSVDVVIVSSAATVDGAITAIGLARHGLSPSGRILVRTTAEPPRLLCDAITRKLMQHGFSAIRVGRAVTRVVFTAELPIFSPIVRIAA
jgi:putative N-acetylmannosamine-6-phosphate epimerase